MSSDLVSTNEKANPRTSWEDWGFAESRLRTAMIYFILGIHFDIDFGLPCNRAYDLKFEHLKLPAAKVLWEAHNEGSWAEELGLLGQDQGENVSGKHSEADLTFGDLKRLNKRLCNGGDSASAEDECSLRRRLDKWFEGMDELGMPIAISSTVP